MDKPKCDPQELVALLRAGDLEAVDRMARCYGERLLAAARRYCRSEPDAQDAFQDALLTAWHARDSYRGEGRLDGWMVRLVASACSRMRRGRKNAPSLHVPNDELSTGEAESPEQQAFQGELAEALRDALAAEGEQDRAILLMSDALGWKGPDIADLLDMTPGAVRTRLSRTRARLRERLEPILPG